MSSGYRLTIWICLICIDIVIGLSLCDERNNISCNNMCNDDDYLLWFIEYDKRIFNKTYNTTQYYYTIIYDHSLIDNNISCFSNSETNHVLIEILPPNINCNCNINYNINIIPNYNQILINSNINQSNNNNNYSYKFTLYYKNDDNNDNNNNNNITIYTLRINIPGNITSTNEGYYMIYENVTNLNSDYCIKQSLITPNVICSDNINITETLSPNINNSVSASACTCVEYNLNNMIEYILNDTLILIISISLIGIVLLSFIILLLIICCLQRKIHKYEEQISDYYEDFRTNKNSEMKSTHYPSVSINRGNLGGLSHGMHGMPHTINSTNNYFTTSTRNSSSSLNFDIVKNKSVHNKYSHSKHKIKKKHHHHRLNNNNDDDESQSSIDEEIRFLNKNNNIYSDNYDNKPIQQLQLNSHSNLRKNDQNNYAMNELTKMNSQKIHTHSNKHEFLNVPAFSPPDDDRQHLVDIASNSDNTLVYRQDAYL